MISNKKNSTEPIKFRPKRVITKVICGGHLSLTNEFYNRLRGRCPDRYL